MMPWSSLRISAVALVTLTVGIVTTDMQDGAVLRIEPGP